MIFKVNPFKEIKYTLQEEPRKGQHCQHEPCIFIFAVFQAGHQFQALEERDPEVLCRRIVVGLCILYLPVAILIKSLGRYTSKPSGSLPY